MIPVRLDLTNFMSYRELSLDFSDIHVACLSGENGAGKSSILDAITWCLWDKARSSDNESLIHLGENEMNVELLFQLDNSDYRVLRTTKKTSSKRVKSALELQILAENGYRAITGKSIRETQKMINKILCMDYETFVNSAFILQGKADEFTTRSATERKKVLAEILNLEKYDLLQEKAKEKIKEIDFDKSQNKVVITQLEEALADKIDISDSLKIKEIELKETKKSIENLEIKINEISLKKEKLNFEMASLNEIKKNYDVNKDSLEKLKNEIITLNERSEKVNNIISNQSTIERNYTRLSELRELNSELDNKQNTFYELEKKISIISREVEKEESDLKITKNNIENKLNNLIKQEEECQKVFKSKAKILYGHENLKKANKVLEEYQDKGVINKRLNDKKYELEKILNNEIQKVKISEGKIRAKISDREKQINQSEDFSEKINYLNNQIKEIDKTQVYMDTVKEKGINLKTEIELNQKNIKDKENDITNYYSKIKKINDLEKGHCPLCDTFIDDKDKEIITKNYKKEIEIKENEIEKIKLNNAKKEKKIVEFRQEYGNLSSQVKKRDLYQNQLGEINQKKIRIEQSKKELVDLIDELKLISEKPVNLEIQEKLEQLNLEIKKVEYDPKNLAVLQSEVNNWKWSEMKYSQLEQAENSLDKINQDKPALLDEFNYLKNQLESRTFAFEKDLKIKNLQQNKTELNYQANHHKLIRDEINELKSYEREHSYLQKALSIKESIESEKLKNTQNKEKLEEFINNDFEKIKKLPDIKIEIISYENNILNNKKEKDNLIDNLTNIKIKISSLNEKLEKYQQYKTDINLKKEANKKLNYEYKLHKELVNAFGKKGIQAVIIENAIPEIENYANILLSRLTEGKMNVSFTTRKNNKTGDKISETLDIFISDELGTRNYEMYSGGEAFRVNFAIRLALSKLLARRSGAKLKTMVIDEGFGTQDSKGISRLIESINAISEDFEKVIIITHINELKEAFPSKIEVYKSIHGSKIKIVH